MSKVFENYDLSSDQKASLQEAFETQLQERLKEAEERKQQEIDIAVDAALKLFDEDATEKTQTLLNNLDVEVLENTKEVVNHIIADKTEKLRNVKEYYESQLQDKAADDFDMLVEKLDSYLEVILTEEIPNLDAKITEAAENRHALQVLEQIQGTLKVDLLPEEVKETVREAKELKKQNAELLIENARKKGKNYLQSRSANLPNNIKHHLERTFEGRSASFIKENFDFVVQQYKVMESRKVKEEGKKVQQNASPDLLTENHNAPRSVQKKPASKSNDLFIDSLLESMNQSANWA